MCSYSLNQCLLFGVLININIGSITKKLDLVSDGNEILVPFFYKNYLISNNEFVDADGDRPGYMTFVILAKYLLLCPIQSHYDAEWVSFKDFRRVSHFTNVKYFSSDTERAIENHSSGQLGE